MPLDEYKDLIKKRGVVKGRFTVFVKYVQSLQDVEISESQKIALEDRCNNIMSLLEQFSTIQDDIELLLQDSEIDLEKQLIEREIFENLFYEITSKAKCTLKSKEIIDNNVKVSNKTSSIKLPTISLPSFDGSFEQWLEFRDTYISLIHNSKTIDDIQKFHYLRLAFDLGIDLDDAQDTVRHFYIGDDKIDENVRWNLADFVTDLIFGHPTQRAAEQLLNNGANTVYRYVFSYKGGRNMLQVAMNLNLTGATHADELGYLFDLDMFSEETTAEDQLVIDRMTMLWTNFAKHGNPTPETSELLPVKWEPITTTTQPYLEINSDLSLQSRPFHERMAFWDMFYKLYGKYQKWSEGSSI